MKLERRRSFGRRDFLPFLFLVFTIGSSIAEPLNDSKGNSTNVTKSDNEEKKLDGLNITVHDNYGFQRRQDGGFDLLNYFVRGNNNPQGQQQQVVNLGQLLNPQPQQLQIQQHQQVQQPQNLQVLYRPQQQQQVQPQQLTQYQQQPQQLIQYSQQPQQQQQQQQVQYHQQSQSQQPAQYHQQLQSQQPVQYQQQVSLGNSNAGRAVSSSDLGNHAYYQDVNGQQQQNSVSQRDGAYGAQDYAAIDNSYAVQPDPKVGISVGIGSGKPIGSVSVGNIISLLPKIFNVLSAGGKVMFGAELGKNFYFGPVGAKPLYKK